MCQCFEREVILDLVKSERNTTFGVVKIPFKKAEVGGMLNISPIWVFERNCRRLDVKGKSRYLSSGSIRRLEPFVDTLPSF